MLLQRIGPVCLHLIHQRILVQLLILADRAAGRGEDHGRARHGHDGAQHCRHPGRFSFHAFVFLHVFDPFYEFMVILLRILRRVSQAGDQMCNHCKINLRSARQPAGPVITGVLAEALQKSAQPPDKRIKKLQDQHSRDRVFHPDVLLPVMDQLMYEHDPQLFLRVNRHRQNHSRPADPHKNGNPGMVALVKLYPSRLYVQLFAYPFEKILHLTVTGHPVPVCSVELPGLTCIQHSEKQNAQDPQRAEDAASQDQTARLDEQAAVADSVLRPLNI